MIRSSVFPSLNTLPPPPPDRSGWPWTEASPQLPEQMPDGSPWPRISVVTPNYNYAHFVEETIRSVLLQGYPNLEYIVIDGGSNDGSVEIVRRYESWLTCWLSESDKGQSQAINKGFAQASGELWGWLNSDDVYYPGALAVVAQMLAQHSRTMLVGAATLTDDPHQLAGREDRRQPDWEEMAYDGRTFPQPSTFWTADLWELSGPLAQDLHYAMDFELWLRMRPYASNVFFTDALLSYERLHEEQAPLRAVRRGEFEPVNSEKAYAVLQAARRRGERPLKWLLKSYGRRFQTAHRYGRYSMLWRSGFHRVALKMALGRGLRNNRRHGSN
ncbi:MAG: glycosyltransferase [Chloroflexi bacterium]|nr:glycosyltransferase [Chloroflexota bacterium]MCI0645873.1 glycosyltransferase [Chloroflexota bacterium]MCI0725728.1 glycosyltransferase [Chloroflexota bacterium]